MKRKVVFKLIFTSLFLFINIGMINDVFGLPAKRTYIGENIKNGIDEYQINESINEEMASDKLDTFKDGNSIGGNSFKTKTGFNTARFQKEDKRKLMPQFENYRETLMKTVGEGNKKGNKDMDVNNDIKGGVDEDDVVEEDNKSRITNDFKMIPHDHIPLNAGYRMKE